MDKNYLRAAAFLKRAGEASDIRQKLLCLYDGFVCLYGPMEACRKAASASGVDFTLLEKVIDYCMDDGDGPDYTSGTTETRKVDIPADMVEKLFRALASIVEKAE